MLPFSKNIYFPYSQYLLPWTMLVRRTLPTLAVLIPIFIFSCTPPSHAATFLYYEILISHISVWRLEFFFFNLATSYICVDVCSQLIPLFTLPAYTVLRIQI